MKFLIALSLLVPSFAFANLCDRYTADRGKWQALETVARAQARTTEEICKSERIVDIEIQPSQVIVQGEIFPQWAVFFHYNEESCKFMVGRDDYTMTSRYCFPTW